MADHAYLSPSSADRWLNCTAAPYHESLFNETYSAAATEGTTAHEVAEIYAKEYLRRGEPVPQKEMNKIFLKSGCLTKPLYKSEMSGYAQAYAQKALDEFKVINGLFYAVEQKVSLSPEVPQSFGTSDLILFSEDTIHVIDYKYGKGVFVAANDNSQMKLYAYGSYKKFDFLFDKIEHVYMTIFQPRMNNIATDYISMVNLIEWVTKKVAPAADKAFHGINTVFVGGEHCRFCKYALLCDHYQPGEVTFSGKSSAKEDFADLLKGV